MKEKKMRREHCANDNHGRAVVTIRCCPSCGETVNARILARSCPADEHARARRAGRTYCVHCGEQVSQGRFAR